MPYLSQISIADDMQNDCVITYYNIPTLNEIIAQDLILLEDERKAAVSAIKVHQAVQGILAFHIQVSALQSEEKLARFLEQENYKGTRDDCAACPLANAYMAIWHKLIGHTARGATVDVSGGAISVKASVYMDRVVAPLGHIAVEMGMSQLHQDFIVHFDSGSYPALDENYDLASES